MLNLTKQQFDILVAKVNHQLPRLDQNRLIGVALLLGYTMSDIEKLVKDF